MNEENLINFEIMGGWPVYKLNLETILKDLGAEEDAEFIKIRKTNPILKLFPKRLEDDGMGYGINEQWIEEVVTDKKSYINIFTSPELPKEKLNEFKKCFNI